MTGKKIVPLFKLKISSTILLYQAELFGWNCFLLGSATTTDNIVFAIHDAYTQPKWWAPCIWFCKTVGMLTLAYELHSAILVKRLLHTAKVRLQQMRRLGSGLNITPRRVWRWRRVTVWQAGRVQHDFPTLYPEECFTEQQKYEDGKHGNSLWTNRLRAEIEIFIFQMYFF